jgi:integrase
MGASLVRGVSRHQLKTLVRTYAERAPVNANRLHAFLSKLCRWAVNEELLDRNPIVALDKPTRETSRERTLTADELRAFWAALDTIAGKPTATRRARAFADLWRLRLLTAQREQTLRRLEWSMVDLDAKTLEFPSALMKKARPHVVPLGTRAAAVLTARRAAASLADRFVFGSRIGAGQAPARTRGVPVGLPDFRGHDLRRTAATLMSQHGIKRFDVARVLAHHDGSVTAVYDRYDYLSEKRVALDTLDRVIGDMLTPTPATASSTVVPFAR